MIIKIYTVGIYLCFWLLALSLEAAGLKENLNLLKILFLVFNVSYVITIPIAVKFIINKVVKNKNIKKYIYIFGVVLFSVFYQLYLFLLIYRLRSGYSFYWSFFWFNKHDAVTTLFRIFGITSWLFFIVLPILIFILFYFNFKKIIKILGAKKFFYGIILGAMAINLFSIILSPATLKGEIVRFVYRNFLTDLETGNYYLKHYDKYLAEIISRKSEPAENLSQMVLGDKIFFIHLESVSSYLISEQATPNLVAASKRGIFFPRVYSNSVQTLRAQESILCGLPPSLKDTINNNFTRQKIESLVCLPKILKSLGYQTLFFKDDSLDFSNTGRFMLDIGFQEVHNRDIMQPSDPRTDWGYREDVFYQRVLEYLDKFYKNQKVFVYIAVSSTNHLPFKVSDQRYLNSIPFRTWTNAKELISNTVYIQDIYLGTLMNALEKYHQFSTTLIFSDHAWPIGIHPGNTNTEFGAYDENFMDWLIWLPPTNYQNHYQPNHEILDRYSEMDILPTFLELSNFKVPGLLGNTFTREIIKSGPLAPPTKNSIVALQPYSGGFIAIIKYPDKYIFDIAGNIVNYYDLADDPNEKNPLTYSQPDKYFYLISDFYNFNQPAYAQ